MKKLIMIVSLGVLSCTSLGEKCQKVSLKKSETTWFDFIKKSHQVVYRDQNNTELVFEKIRSKRGYTTCNTFEIGPNQFEYISVQQKLSTGSIPDRNKKYDVKQMAGDTKNQIDLYFFDFWVSFTPQELLKNDTKTYTLKKRDYSAYKLSSRKASNIDSLYWSPNIGVISFKYGDAHFTLQ